MIKLKKGSTDPVDNGAFDRRFEQLNRGLLNHDGEATLTGHGFKWSVRPMGLASLFFGVIAVGVPSHLCAQAPSDSEWRVSKSARGAYFARKNG
jgi:hypothetical protein